MGRDILKEYNVNLDDIEKEVAEIMGGEDTKEKVESNYYDSIQDFEVGTVLKGRILSVLGDNVIVDCGYKSEGMVPKFEFDDPSEIKIGEEVEVLLEAVEDDSGLIKLSKRKASRIRGWERVIAKYKEGDIIIGRVTRKIKGGLLVDMGVPIFLPASQIDVKPPGDIAQYIGQEVTCKILKIDEARQNIVVSRRKLIEEDREKKKKQLLTEIEIGQVRKGVVKNIADFGAFIDLGGLDGLLHITDMSWGRISHPSEVLAIDDEVDVKILDIDKEKEKVALGLKQKTENPWVNIEEKYPVGSRVKGQVVNIMSYGAFVKLETGIEGLVHISEMSWTRRINHPSEMVAIGDTVEVIVLKIDKEKEEISLSMKQTEVNPWTIIEEKYPAGTKIKGRVRNLTNYGAFIEIEEGVDGLLHISDMSWAKKVGHPSEIVKKGDKIEAIVLSVDREKKRVALGLKQLSDDPWIKEIPGRFKVGDVVKGTVTKLTNFGAFLELGHGIEGLLHISELSNEKVTNPGDVVNIGDELEVRVIRIEPEARKIGLSLKKLSDSVDEDLYAASSPGTDSQLSQIEIEDVSEKEASTTDTK
jgi:small subunit ribosomal protein S1